ncbi:MAG: SDR family oxidoreductase [Azoarcus sp.]|jgi:NAD(P)-dependent dehydrogenase (short-subunit alcohol dehydrogenase family)|nr:SDR family oxidoreductase [Azoarcus sp.]
MAEFDGKVALVTGGASGIGRATALKLARNGAAVLIVDLAAVGINAVAAEIAVFGGKATPFVADVTNPDAIAAAVAMAESKYGALHLAFNNAGITGPSGLLADIDIEAYRQVIEVNLNSVFYGMHAEIPAILRAGGGAIVNTASILGLVGQAASAGYATAKHGVTGLTKVAALDYADKGIRINSIHPGYIDTPLLKHLSPEMRQKLTSRHAMGRFGTEEEIAETVIFLLSGRASFVTGSQLVADGGYTTQ